MLTDKEFIIDNESIRNDSTFLKLYELEPRFTHYASEIMGLLGFDSFSEMQPSIERAMKVCRSLHIPESVNFMEVYRSDGESTVLKDFHLTALASYLVIINSDPEKDGVARAQLYYFIKNCSK